MKVPNEAPRQRLVHTNIPGAYQRAFKGLSLLSKLRISRWVPSNTALRAAAAGLSLWRLLAAKLPPGL